MLFRLNGCRWDTETFTKTLSFTCDSNSAAWVGPSTRTSISFKSPLEKALHNSCLLTAQPTDLQAVGQRTRDLRPIYAWLTVTISQWIFAKGIKSSRALLRTTQLCHTLPKSGQIRQDDGVPRWRNHESGIQNCPWWQPQRDWASELKAKEEHFPELQLC